MYNFTDQSICGTNKVTDAHEDTTEEDDKVSEDILTKIRRRSSTFLSDIFRKDSDPD